MLLLSGAVIPFLQIMPWLVDHGLDVRLFVDELFARREQEIFRLRLRAPLKMTKRR